MKGNKNLAGFLSFPSQLYVSLELEQPIRLYNTIFHPLKNLAVRIIHYKSANIQFGKNKKIKNQAQVQVHRTW